MAKEKNKKIPSKTANNTPIKKGILGEFRAFLKEYKVTALAVAFIMGVAINALVKSLVDNIIMPLVTPFVPQGAWESATFTMGKAVIGWGAFIGELINFIIIAFVVFVLAKIVLHEEEVHKK